ncbi:recombinase family protein [Blastopirellula sp. JC732]|uniref:Recombinase family protein n=1 Tax=Blastopirellula sediminis TaxID=2894196 RepID=A0A9X1MLS6_9BACT|nr:recombinase family protein [Blastopirellula sediminis]MCC9608265.1 recombinase family protein [Blastopirellula sediminis]MCC9628936.1 recombinase family protein [Blastopirellula sediminis]
MTNHQQGFFGSANVIRVLIVARISTEHQDPRSLDDQVATCRRWCDQNLPDRFKVVEVIQSRGSGERLDRRELRDLEDAIELRTCDLVIAEDLGRICRRSAAITFLELAEDNDVRVVTLNDDLDTDQDDWRFKAGFATMRHEFSNADTSKRIRRTLRNRFGQGMIKTVPYGYIKPSHGATDAEVTKDPKAELIIAEMIERLEKGESYSVVVDWLNLSGVPTGRYVRSNKWTVSTLSNLLHNPILKGVREANRKISKRINKTGRRVSVKAPPEELLVRECSHLAYLDADRYDRLIRMLDERNAPFRRKKVNGRDSRANVPKKRTRFPGQQTFCGICGHPFVWGGHGQQDHMMCKGAKEYACWQSASFDGTLAAEKILTAVYDEIEALPEFPETLYQAVQAEFWALTGARKTQTGKLEREIASLEREMNNLVEFIASGNASASIAAKITEREEQISDAKLRLKEMTARPDAAPQLPLASEVREIARNSLKEMASDPYALSRVMRQLIRRIDAFPIRLCDGGALFIRAKFELRLSGLFPDLSEIPAASELLTRTLEVDLFDPVQREQHREEIVALRAAGKFQRQIAAELRITQPAVQNALRLQARMNELGLEKPYVPVDAPPADLLKMRRHKHPRYKFQPKTNEIEQ